MREPSKDKSDFFAREKQSGIDPASGRASALREAGYNVMRVPSSLVQVDLETDGGKSCLSEEQMAALTATGLDHRLSVDLEERLAELIGFPYVVSACHGRAAESLWTQVRCQAGTVVLANLLFPTSLFHHFQNLCRVFECGIPEAYQAFSPHPFKGNLGLAKLERTAQDWPGRVAYIWVEPCCNAAGGHPVSLQNLKQVRAFADRRGLQVVLNLTRVLENALLLEEREPGASRGSLASSVAEFCSLADAAVMSAAKDFLSPQGGFVAVRDRATFEQLQGLCYIKGVQLGRLDRALIGRGLREALSTDAIPERMNQVKRLHSRLKSAGLPVLEPVGGHAVYLDVNQSLPELPPYHQPAEALASFLLERSGVRARAGFTTLAQSARGVRTLRLAVPPRRYTESEIDYAAEAVIDAFEHRHEIAGLVPKRRSVGLAALTGRGELYAKGRPGQIAAFTLARLVWDRLEALSTRVMAQIEAGDGVFERLTFGDLGAEAKKIAAALVNLGFGKGDRIVILAENSRQWLALDAACLALGMVTVPIYPPTPRARAEKLAELSGAVAALCSNTEQLEKVLSVEQIRCFVLLEPAEAADNRRVFDWSALLARGTERLPSEEEWQRTIDAIGEDDLATIMYTSGTTGLPSGVVISHRNWVASLLCSSWPFFEDKSYYYPVLLDLNHVLGRSSYYTALHNGFATVVLPKKIDMNTDVRLFELFPPSVMVLVPRVIDRLVRTLKDDSEIASSLRIIDDWELGGGPTESLRSYQDARRKLALRVRAKLGGRIMYIVHAGAPLALTHQRFFKLAGVMLAEGYGMTECGVISANAVYDIRKEGTVGLTHAYTDVRISEEGEIQVRGPMVTPGYFQEPDRNRQSYTGDGWFKTGDRGRFDDEGYLCLTGRIKDTYNLSDGSNIYPVWIEEILKNLRLVDQAILIGDLRPYVTALLVPDRAAVERELGVTLSPGWSRDARVSALFEEELEAVNAHLAPPEQIRKFRLLEDRFPEDCIGEIPSKIKLHVDRARVGTCYEREIAELYS